jgi:hypothetical protein
MSSATEADRRRALEAASEAERRDYRRAIDRAIDQAEAWRGVEQDKEATVEAVIGFLHRLRAETDPFVVPPTPDQRAAVGAQARLAAHV